MITDKSKIKVIGFDLFGTLIDFSYAKKEDKIAYGKHIGKRRWSPFCPPKYWELLPVHSDVQWLYSLSGNFSLCTMSNAPFYLQKHYTENGVLNSYGLQIIPIELKRVFKPNPKAYQSILETYRVQPEEVLIVTANEEFGDLEAANELGMQSALICRETRPCVTEGHDFERLGDLSKFLKE